MKKRRVVLVITLLAMSFCVLIAQDYYWKGGGGDIYWSHNGRDVEGNLEWSVSFVVLSKKMSTGKIDSLEYWPSLPTPDSLNTLRIQLQIDASRYKIGVYAIDAALNKSDTLWSDFYVCAVDTVPPSKPCGITCYK